MTKNNETTKITFRNTISLAEAFEMENEIISMCFPDNGGFNSTMFTFGVKSCIIKYYSNYYELNNMLATDENNADDRTDKLNALYEFCMDFEATNDKLEQLGINTIQLNNILSDVNEMIDYKKSVLLNREIADRLINNISNVTSGISNSLSAVLGTLNDSLKDINFKEILQSSQAKLEPKKVIDEYVNSTYFKNQQVDIEKARKKRAKKMNEAVKPVVDKAKSTAEKSENNE